MVHRSVLQWTRGERVPLSLYERTVFVVLHFHFMTAFQRRPKMRRVFPFPNNHRRPSKVFYITPCVKCDFTHASRAEIRIFTLRDIKFRTILVRKTFSWRMWLHYSPLVRAANSHSSEKVLSHSYRNVLFFFFFSIFTTLLLTFFSTFSIRPSIFVVFLILQRLSSLFFLLSVYGLAFPHFFTSQQVTNAAGFGVRIG